MPMNSEPVPAARVRFTSTVALSLTFLVIFSSAVVVAKLNYPAEAASMPLIIGGFGAALSLLQPSRHLTPILTSNQTKVRRHECNQMP